jgi:hypothetical protein
LAETEVELLETILTELLRDDQTDGPIIELGDILPAGTPSFACRVADIFAAKTGLPRLDEFRRAFATRDTAKPSRPSPDFIQAQAKAIESDPAKAPYLRGMIERRLETKYFADLSRYEQDRQARERIQADYQDSDLGYLHFLCAAYPPARSFFFDRYRTLPISEESRKRHTYITGGAGSGKSEALKAIIFHYVARNTAPAVVLIDPHGDVAEQVAHWPEFADGHRLAYIDPNAKAGLTPVFNPLDISDSERNPDDIAIVVRQLIEIFPELIEGLEFTPNMRTLISACLTVLLYAPGSTLADLMDFLDSDRNGRWLDLADRVLVGSMYRDFFKREFKLDSMEVTKRGVRLRLIETLQGNPAFKRLIVGKSTFNLEELLNRRAVVIFRLTRGGMGESTSNIVGKFIVARLKAFAFKQGRLPEAERVPVHVFIDECQNFLSASIAVILKEARKYGVHLTLAQQILGDGMSPDLLKAILGNTAVKITGINALFTLKKIAEETGADLDDLQALSTGYFHIKSGNRPSLRVRMPANRLNEKGGVPAEIWEQVFAGQLARFYAPDIQDSGDKKPKIAPAASSANPLPID